jgi:cobalt/nickel transport system permease protein
MTLSPLKSLCSLERLAKKDTFVHRLNPATKIAAALAYVLVCVSFNRYNITALLYLSSCPILVSAVAELPLKDMLSRLTFSLPFCLFVGFSGLLVNRISALHVGSLPISFGFISFVVIFMRMILTVSAFTILLATTSFPALTKCLLKFHVPRVLMLAIEMVYRYLNIVMGEGRGNYDAWALRSRRRRPILRNVGGFTSMLFMRNIDRAKKTYAAMKLRGCSVCREDVRDIKLTTCDWMSLAVLFAYLHVITTIAS